MDVLFGLREADFIGDYRRMAEFLLRDGDGILFANGLQALALRVQKQQRANLRHARQGR